MLYIALLPEEYAVCQLPAGSPVATGLAGGSIPGGDVPSGQGSPRRNDHAGKISPRAGRDRAGPPFPGQPDQPARNPPDPPELISITWTANHVSVICPMRSLPAGVPVETPWRCLRVLGPVNQAMTDTLATLVTPLAEARVSIVAFSAYDTDYLLVPTVRLTEALAVLTRAGHQLRT